MRYICIHGHFYQPPRENPWLEEIEIQDSAYPYHDWNERITAECYAPNAVSRILDGQRRISHIVNNYSRLSFNFGPTLLSWAERHAPELYAHILRADRESMPLNNGHGSAVAQNYGHLIMPLCNTRDKRTQVRWGVADFVHRFGRQPEGMWLAETAVDIESLEYLAAEGVKFTILAPSQAQAFRPVGTKEWIDVSGARIDPRRPYLQHLPSGKSIALFFYDGPISRGVAFERLLNSGETFANRLTGAFDSRTEDQLVHIATDGETYGHHHRFGDMALAYAIRHIEEQGLAKVVNYAAYLAAHPPQHEVQIIERTAWSCVHGVGRWERDCGCNTGGRPGWNQRWRGPLRQALDLLRDAVRPLYEREAGRLLRDPWAARDAYIDVVLDRSLPSRQRFLAAHALHTLSEAERVRCWRLLELQRHAMLMYTSCGWFFDELSGIETVQVLQYAGRVVELAEKLGGEGLESRFTEALAEAHSNLPEYGGGANVFRQEVLPARIDLRSVAAHYALSQLFADNDEAGQFYSHRVQRQDHRRLRTGRMRLVIGRARFTSEITEECETITYGALHLGDHTVSGGVRVTVSEQEYTLLSTELAAAYMRADFAEVIRLMDRAFKVSHYSLRTLFRDQQREILSRITEDSLAEARQMYRQLYERQAPLLRFLQDLGTPLPKAFHSTAEYALNSYLREELSTKDIDTLRVLALLDEARRSGVELDTTTLEFTFRRNLEANARFVRTEPLTSPALVRLVEKLNLLEHLPFKVNTWSVQNDCFTVLQERVPLLREQRDEDAQLLLGLLRTVGERLELNPR